MGDWCFCSSDYTKKKILYLILCSNFDFDEVNIDILLLLMRTSSTIKEEFHRNESNQLRIVYFPFIAWRRGLTSDDLAVCASLGHFIVRDECTLARAYGLAASVVKKRNVNGPFLYIFIYLSVLKTCQFGRLNCCMPQSNGNTYIYKQWPALSSCLLSHHSRWQTKKVLLALPNSMCSATITFQVVHCSWWIKAAANRLERQPFNIYSFLFVTKVKCLTTYLVQLGFSCTLCMY